MPAWSEQLWPGQLAARTAAQSGAGILDVSRDLVLIQNDFLGSAVLKIEGKSDISLNNVVLAQPTRWREMKPTGGNVIRAGTRFVWPAYLTPKPQIGNIIVANSTYWTAWKVEYKPHVETYETDCLNLNIVNTAFNKVLLLRATYVKSQANEAKAIWVGYNSGLANPTAADTVRAAVQPSSEDATLEFGAESGKELYRIFFEHPIPGELAGGAFRVVSAYGHRFRVNRYADEHRLDTLPVAICEKITEGNEWFQGNPPVFPSY